MLVIEDNSVYEIDEECVKRKRIPKECRIYEKILQEQKKEGEERNKEKRS